MGTRRAFIKKLGIFGGNIVASQALLARELSRVKHQKDLRKDIILSTWSHGIPANARAMEVLKGGGSILDAVERGVMVVESDANNGSVGLGGRPDRDGHVTLDASIMDAEGSAGSVCFLEGFEHPVSIARAVMEKTPHVMLAGDGAAQFAREQGFEEIDLLTSRSKREWEKWKEKSNYEPEINVENHDTIGMVGLHGGEVAGSCTTSGLAYKMHGRVGDSPVIGAGLFVDGEVGACACTGLGEYVLKSLTSFLVVELMGQGITPKKACRIALERIKKKYIDNKPNSRFQVGLVAINVEGAFGGYSILPGYQYAIHKDGQNILVDAPYLMR